MVSFTRLRADWALPVGAPPIPNPAILIGSDGRLGAIGPDASVPSPVGAESVDLAGVILVPGLVNTHTHLELTGFENQAPESEFRDWILTIRRIKETRSREGFLEAARRGIRDCWRGGVTTIADTGDSGAVIEALAELGGSGIVFQEVFGPDPAQCDESFTELASRVASLKRFEGPRIRLGVSPHAPYTVSGPLYRKVADFARREALPVAVHIAESPEETEFVSRGRGPFAEGWRKRAIPPIGDPAQLPSGPPLLAPSPIEWIEANGVLGPATLCIHAIQLAPGDAARLASHGAAVAHCPLSNHRHHARTAPLTELLARGIRVGLGTDSVASIGSLDLLAEGRAARRDAGLTPEATLRLLTIEGARALGLEGQIGSLVPGKWADLAGFAVPPGGAPGPEAALGAVVEASAPRVVFAMVSGRAVHRAAAPA